MQFNNSKKQLAAGDPAHGHLDIQILQPIQLTLASAGSTQAGATTYSATATSYGVLD